MERSSFNIGVRLFKESLHQYKQRSAPRLQIARGMFLNSQESCVRVPADFWGAQLCQGIAKAKHGQQSLKSQIFTIT